MLRRSRIGRSLTDSSLKVLETLRFVPQGSARVPETLNLCGEAMIAAGLCDRRMWSALSPIAIGSPENRSAATFRDLRR